MFNEPKTYLFFLLMSMLAFVVVTAILYFFAVIQIAVFIFSIFSLGDSFG